MNSLAFAALGAVQSCFLRDGVVHLPGIARSDEVDELESRLEHFVANTAPGLADGSVVVAPGHGLDEFRVLENLAVDPFFEDVGRRPKWTGLAAWLLGAPVCPANRDEYSEVGWQALFNLAPATGDATPPHQDNYYYKFEPGDALSLWIALDDIDDSNGGLRYVPGSHRLGLRRHVANGRPGFSQVIPDFGADDEAREVTFKLRRGDVVAHHGGTIHRSGENRSGRRRWGYSMFFRAAHCRRDRAAYAQYLDELREHNRRFARSTA